MTEQRRKTYYFFVYYRKFIARTLNIDKNFVLIILTTYRFCVMSRRSVAHARTGLYILLDLLSISCITNLKIKRRMIQFLTLFRDPVRLSLSQFMFCERKLCSTKIVCIRAYVNVYAIVDQFKTKHLPQIV